MKCNRCGGLMSHEEFFNETLENFSGWRCIVCGEIVDEVILRNRSGGLKTVKVSGLPPLCKSNNSYPSKDSIQPATVLMPE